MCKRSQWMQHGVMLREHWDYDRGILRALAFVNGRRVGRHQHVEFAESISDGLAIEVNNDLAHAGVNIADSADVAVVNLLVVVVLDLHHLIARCEGPTEPLNLAVAGGIERCLQLDVQRSRTYSPSIHWTKHLDVADRIEPKPLGDACLHQFDDAADGSWGIVRRHEVEIALGSRWTEIRHRALIDAMGAGDDAALCGLPEYFAEPRPPWSMSC
jgi:hypothetical protein